MSRIFSLKTGESDSPSANVETTIPLNERDSIALKLNINDNDMKRNSIDMIL